MDCNRAVIGRVGCRGPLVKEEGGAMLPLLGGGALVPQQLEEVEDEGVELMREVGKDLVGDAILSGGGIVREVGEARPEGMFSEPRCERQMGGATGLQGHAIRAARHIPGNIGHSVLFYFGRLQATMVELNAFNNVRRGAYQALDRVLHGGHGVLGSARVVGRCKKEFSYPLARMLPGLLDPAGLACTEIEIVRFKDRADAVAMSEEERAGGSNVTLDGVSGRSWEGLQGMGGGGKEGGMFVREVSKGAEAVRKFKCSAKQAAAGHHNSKMPPMNISKLAV